MRPLGPPQGSDAPRVRLDAYLAAEYPFYSRAAWQSKIRCGHLLISGRQVRPGYRLRVGDRLEMYSPRQKEPEVSKDLYPLWKQGEIMAVYKPSNLPMHENGPYRKNTFAHLVKEIIGPDWAAVHRLDRETSGIVLCSRCPELRKDLAMALADRDVEKEYLAICMGEPQHDDFTEKGPIGDLVESKIRIKKWVVPDGLPAETRFSFIDRRGGYSLVRARPKTGRTNQIRIHAAYNGLPLVGDKLYHPDESIFEEYFENRGNTDRVVEATGFHRLCLHAAMIQFRSPVTGESCRVDCPMPDELKNFWDSLSVS